MAARVNFPQILRRYGRADRDLVRAGHPCHNRTCGNVTRHHRAGPMMALAPIVMPHRTTRSKLPHRPALIRSPSRQGLKPTVGSHGSGIFIVMNMPPCPINKPPSIVTPSQMNV